MYDKFENTWIVIAFLFDSSWLPEKISKIIQIKHNKIHVIFKDPK